MPFTNSHRVMFVKREPVAVAGAASVIVALAAAFGFDLDEEAVAVIVSAVVAVASLIARSKVTPTADPKLNDD